MKLFLYGVRHFGLWIMVVILFKFIKWRLTTGRRQQNNWQLGESKFHWISEGRVVKIDGRYVFSPQLPPLPSRAFDNMLMPSKPRSAQNNRVVLYPSYANIAVTGRCLSRCWHCSVANRIDYQSDLPLETWTSIIRQLQDVGVFNIGITGGEPLIRNDLEEIISSADQRSVLGMATSGIGLTYERAKRLKAVGLFYVVISLDHYRPEVNDRLRGFTGAYEAAVQAMHYFRQVNLYVSLQAAITKEFVAKDEIWKLVELGREIGIQQVRCRGIVPAGRLVKIDRSALLTEQDRQLFMQSANRINNQPDYPFVSLFEDFEHPTCFGCSAGGMHVYVDCNGNLCPCDFVPLSFGNLRKEAFESVWLRMRDALGIPQRSCLACFVADYIADRDLEFPLPLELSREICQLYRTPELPDFYL
jgi:MoaA/NifB/PqqE/SkfB family radical SAM enzyme